MTTPKPYFFGHVDENGKLELENRDLYIRHLHTLKGKDVRLLPPEIKPNRRPPASREQQRYYHAVPVAYIADYSGHTHDEVHEFLKKKFNPIEIMGDVIGGSTTEFDTAKMHDYIERIRAWAARDLGIDIPDPEQVKY